MKHDLVLWGATGFTGRLTAGYLARHAHGLSWALAGRRREALEAVREELGAISPAAADLPLIVADASQPETLDALASQARVVCTTVGPYARYGEPLVAACIKRGAHYCDLTGEPQFMHRTIQRWHAEAAAARVRIVHACGFDSVPSDLGCFLAQERALQAWGHALPRVTLYVRSVRGGISGGTLASVAELMDRSDEPDIRRVLADPYALLPEGAPPGPRVHDIRGVRFDREEEVWTGPFVMAATNGKVVRRTNALLDQRFGAQAYEEVVAYPSGARGALRALTRSAALGAGLAALRVRPLRDRLIGRLLPAPGEGPDALTRARGSFHLQVVARGAHGGRPVQVRVDIRGDQDPGYGATAGMLAESALCLAADPLPDRFGVLTPASAMGSTLVERLARAGVTFDVAQQPDAAGPTAPPAAGG